MLVSGHADQTHNMNLIRRFLIFGLLTSILQWLLYAVTFFILRLIGNLSGNPDFISLYGLSLSLTLFGIILLLQNSLTSIINKKWFSRTALILALMFYYIGWGEDFNSWPLQTLAFLIVGTVVLISKFYIDKRLAVWTGTARTANSA